MKRALTTGEVAHYCGVNFRTVIRWIKSGKLNAYQLPGRGDNRVSWVDFIAFLERRESPLRSRRDKRRVFVVDDDWMACRAFERALHNAGYVVATSTDSFSAGVLLRACAPDLVLLDLRMPGPGGLDIIRSQRAKSQKDAPRILVVSGLPQAHLQQARQAGADDALAKPFDARTLIDKVQYLIGPARGSLSRIAPPSLKRKPASAIGKST